MPNPNTPKDARKGKAAEFDGRLAILPDSREASYEPTKEDEKREGDAGGVEETDDDKEVWP